MIEYGGDIYAEMNRRGVPFGAGIELTARCNLDCIHCYHVRAAGPELDTRELYELLADLSALGVMELTFTGGEPLTRSDFFEAVRSAVEEYGFSVKVFSNLTLLDRRKADLLARIPLNRVETTLLGPDSPLHDSLTRCPGSFEKTLAGIRLLLDRGVRVRIKTVILKQNHHAAADIAGLAEKLGAPYQADDGVFVESDGRRGPLALRISEAEMLRDRRKRTGFSAKNKPHPCNAARSVLHIAPDGAVFPCGPFPVSAGNIRESSLESIWRKAPLMEYLRVMTDADYRSCRNCRYLARCNGCLAMGSGLARGRKYPCRLARKRIRPFVW